MTKNTKIEWADHTFNPWIGCTKVSPACDHCYAENMMDTRLKVVKWGAGQERKRTSESNWQQPLKWNEEAKKLGVRHRVFCASLADVFDNNVNPEWLADLLTLIRLTQNLDWLLLTKRIGNLNYRLEQAFKSVESDDTTESTIDFNRFVWSWINGSPPNNVWLGITVCNQKEADRDIPKLLAAPAVKRFLSIEPLLGSIDLHMRGNLFEDADGAPYQFVDWVIVGGESGNQARPMHIEWVRSLRDQCTAASVSFIFKQWGEWVPRSPCYHTFENGKSCEDIDPGARKFPLIKLNENGSDGHRLEDEDGGDTAYMQRLGKKSAGRVLDGREWNEVPA